MTENKMEEGTNVKEVKEEVRGAELVPVDLDTNKKKKGKKKKLKIALLIILLLGLIGGGAGVWYYNWMNKNLAEAKKIWRDHAEEHLLGSYDYHAEGYWNKVIMTIDVETFSELSNSLKMKYLKDLEQKCSEVKGFDLDYEFFSDDVEYWIKGDFLCTDTGQKIDVVEEKCDEICVLFGKDEFDSAKDEIEELSVEEFEKFESKLTQSYIDMVMANKVAYKVTEDGNGVYLGLTSYDFEEWETIEEIGSQLEELGATNISRHISYAKAVQDLEMYSEYNTIIQYLNSFKFSRLFNQLFDGVLTERAIAAKISALNTYDFSDLLWPGGKDCVRLYDCLIAYLNGAVDLYNGTWAGYGSSVAQRGSEALVQAMDELKNIFEEVGGIQREVVQAVSQLPAI